MTDRSVSSPPLPPHIDAPQWQERTVLRWDRTALGIIFALAVALAVFQIWQGMTGAISATYFRPIHLCWVMVLIFLKYPLVAEESRYFGPGRLVDVALAGLALFAGLRIVLFDYQSIEPQLYGLAGADFWAGVILIALTLEATRRAVGWVMAAIGATFLLYNAFGYVLPDIVANRGFSAEHIVRFQVFTQAGVFGSPLGIASGAVFIFVLFGAFLEVSGAGKFFIDLAYAVAGKYKGGPAKASVLASAAMGSISGSAIANTVTTGSLTIPMMKKLGYRPEQAAGIEAAASTGGQIMPPIMGAGAFIMSEFTNTPYSDIVLISILPAILYFGCTLLYVHLMACKLGLEGMKDRPAAMATLLGGAHYMLPLLFITALLLMSYSPVLVGTAGIAAIIAASFLRRHTFMHWRMVIEGLKSGALLILPISAACATAGIVVGVVGQTGLGLQFTEFVVSLSGGQLWLALILITVAALILGMGLPVTAAYIVLSVMAAPALEGMGLELVTAHMIIFWLSQTSNVTPPIALAAFAGAGVANAKPMASAVEAFKLAKGFFLIPLMMAYSDLLALPGIPGWQVAVAAVLTAGVIAAFAFSVEGYGFVKMTGPERFFLLLSVPLMLIPGVAALAGVALLALVLTINGMRAWKMA